MDASSSQKAPAANPNPSQLSPSVSQTALLAVLWTGTTISLLTVAARLAIRWRLLAKFKTDDYLVMFAMVTYATSTITLTAARENLVPYLRINIIDVTKLPDVLAAAAVGLHANLASYICSWTCLWAIKLSFMAFFHALGRQIRFQRIIWWSILFLILATYIVCISILDYGCLTGTADIIMEKCMSQKTVDYEYANTRVTTTFDIVTDLSIVGLSANIVWRAGIPLRKKLMLACICSLTVFMVVVAIVRITVGAPGKAPDLSWLLLWNSVEMTLAIFVACIASFRSLYCQTRRPHRASDGTPPHPRKKTSARTAFLSTLNTGTLFEEETTQWFRQGLTEAGEPRFGPDTSGVKIIALSDVSDSNHV
ncbi:hypothetical protein CDD83_2301 [Cordyceps sp. RAO-2017]|nr:hypothetical protein CDD83_2301 [Cordyceps sp. RAO-2017]